MGNAIPLSPAVAGKPHSQLVIRSVAWVAPVAWVGAVAWVAAAATAPRVAQAVTAVPVGYGAPAVMAATPARRDADRAGRHQRQQRRQRDVRPERLVSPPWCRTARADF